MSSRLSTPQVSNCNDLFSRFEQQTSILEKLAEATDPTTERHGYDGPSRVSRPKTLRNSEIWVSELCDDLQDGPSQARRPVTGCANPRQSRISGEVLRDVFGLFFP